MTEPGALVLVADDEPPMRRFLRASLAASGYRVVEAESASEATARIADHNPELVLLDLGLPDADGVEVVRAVRGWSRVPIVVVSARGREQDKVDALDAGADDYLTKPFGTAELLARIRVALRHAHEAGGAPSAPTQVGPLRLDFARREVTLEGRPVHLTPIEYRLLVLLVRNAGRVLTHRQILKEVWGPGHAEHAHYLRVYMAQLRRKLEPEPARPRLLATEPGVGYRLREG